MVYDLEFTVDTDEVEVADKAFPIRFGDAATLLINPDHALGEVGTFSFELWATLFEPF